MADRILGMLPDVFLKPDGSRVQGAADWREQRARLLELVVQTEYGGLPPVPDSVEVELLSRAASYCHCRVHISHFTFCLRLYLPEKSKGPWPVILTGDGCYRNMNDRVIDEINRRGMIAAIFNRVEFAPDLYNSDRTAGIYLMYPNSTFGAIAAWAWGYHRAMDALCTLDFVDASRVAITGHSRGGKTVLLAGATDERFAYVNPNNSGAAGSGCYRYHMELDNPPEGVEDTRSEVLGDLLRAVPYWLGPAMRQYEQCEERIPFDQHMLKALVAPRVLLETEGLDDTWSNPKGTWQTHMAATEVWKLLGAPRNIAARYRPGGHAHDFGAFEALMDRMQHGSLPEANPYPDMQPIFEWSAPACRTD
jgi:dienelactone hydrolase